VRIGNHLHAHHRARLTYDALAAGKPRTPLGLLLHDAVAVVGAGGCGDRCFHLAGRQASGWALAMPSPLHGQLTNFLILFHYCDG
jgi:hypothetical protein